MKFLIFSQVILRILGDEGGVPINSFVFVLFSVNRFRLIPLFLFYSQSIRWQDSFSSNTSRIDQGIFLFIFCMLLVIKEKKKEIEIPIFDGHDGYENMAKIPRGASRLSYMFSDIEISIERKVKAFRLSWVGF